MSVPQTPKRTHLLRSLIDNQRVRADGPLHIRTTSHDLAEAVADLDLASRIAQGTSGAELPVLYLSRRDDGTLALSETAVTKLALDLCGVTHVVVEPSRGFSFDIREKSGGRNVYGGTLGLSLPGRGFVRRLYLGPALPDEAALSETARRTAVDLRTAMPTALGWDWHDLQDEILREQRARDRNRLSGAEKEALWQAEVQSLEEKNRELQAQVDALRAAERDQEQEEPPTALPDLDFAEAYPGEIRDRLRAAAQLIQEVGPNRGWDARSLSLFGVLASWSASPGLTELREELKRATNDSKKAADAVERLLLRHGYGFKSDNGHPRLAALDGFSGLQAVTLSKSPSDYRAGENLRGQVEAAMGLKLLG